MSARGVGTALRLCKLAIDGVGLWDQIIIKKEKQILRAMYKPQPMLEKLRSSQRFLSREEPGARRWTLCCCEEADMEEEDLLAPAFSHSPQPKISIRKLKRQSPQGCTHTNSDFSLSKQSQRSNLPISKKTTQTHIPPCPHCHHQPPQKPLLQNIPANVTFLYSTPAPLPEKINHYNVKTHVTSPLPHPQTQAAPVRLPQQPAKPKQLDESIQKEFKTILDFGDNNARQEYTYGEAFPIQPDPPKAKAAQGMSHFSFGQNQKEQFMSKYLGVRQEGVGSSSKQNSKRSQKMMREIIEQRMSKSSKSSGRVFVRGTFNRQSQNLSTFGQRGNFMYKSQSEVSLQSSQSLVLETCQSIMRKRESFIRDYQY